MSEATTRAALMTEHRDYIDGYAAGLADGRRIAPQPAVPVVEAFAEGWKMAADWANRDDLLPDMDSPQYAKERDERLAELRPAVEPMTPEQREVLAALVVGACEHKTRTLLALRAIEATEAQYGIGIKAKAEGVRDGRST